MDTSIEAHRAGCRFVFYKRRAVGVRITLPDTLCFKRKTIQTLQAITLTKAYISTYISTSEIEFWEVNTRATDLF